MRFQSENAVFQFSWSSVDGLWYPIHFCWGIIRSTTMIESIYFFYRSIKKEKHGITILLSGLNISGAIQPSVPIAPVWHVTELRPYASFLQSPKSDIIAFTSPLALRFEISTLWGLMSRWTESKLNFLERNKNKKNRLLTSLHYLQNKWDVKISKVYFSDTFYL